MGTLSFLLHRITALVKIIKPVFRLSHFPNSPVVAKLEKAQSAGEDMDEYKQRLSEVGRCHESDFGFKVLISLLWLSCSKTRLLQTRIAHAPRTLRQQKLRMIEL